MTSPGDLERRVAPRYPTRHQVDGASLDHRLRFRGILHNLSATGCGLHLDRPLPLETPIEFRCNISGIGLAVRGRTVWTAAALGGILHGVAVTGYVSEEDALFHRLYLGHLARTVPASPAA